MSGTRGASTTAIQKELEYQADLQRQRAINAPFWNRVAVGMEPGFVEQLNHRPAGAQA